MSKVRILTDSTSDIPQEIREELGIVMVPLKVLFGEEVYADAVTIGSDEFYEKLQASSQLPTTSQPSPIEFMEVYEQLLVEDANAPILSFHLSSAMSGTYQSAVLGQSMLEGYHDITVVDSKSASYGFGFRVVAAAKLAKAGKSKEEILENDARLASGLHLYFLVDTLEYLQKGGRIGKASALIGSILNIKPILSITNEGEVHAVDKVRGQKKALGRIIELLKQDFGPDEPVDIMIAWSQRNEMAMELCEQVKSSFNVRDITYTKLGAVIGTHVGPGTSAVFMYKV
ncbi:DegV family protein [Paenibacillus sp. GCM10023252]|uniref:DegV family protein n=1 Tax=Paenibacillus sp. GCM10023252 TaxID=3252649 RepID=UPI00362042D9